VLRGLPSGSAPTVPPLVGSRRQGQSQSTSKKETNAKHWVRVAARLGTQKQVWKKKEVLRVMPAGSPAPAFHGVSPIAHVRNSAKNAKIAELFPEFSQKNFKPKTGAKFAGHRLEQKANNTNAYQYVPNPGPLKVEAPGVYKGADRAIPQAPLGGNGEANAGAVYGPFGHEHAVPPSPRPQVVNPPPQVPQNRPVMQPLPLAQIIRAPVAGPIHQPWVGLRPPNVPQVQRPIFVEVEDACEGYFNDPGVCKYQCEFRDYIVPIGQFRGFWSQHLKGHPDSQKYGMFLKGELTTVRLPAALVGTISEYWAHTSHDDKLESFLVSVAKTKHAMRQIQFPTPESAVTAAMYVPMYCYVAYWSEQQALNSVVHEIAVSRSTLWAGSDLISAACFGVASLHIAAPVFLTGGIVFLWLGIAGKVYDFFGRSWTRPYRVPLVRNDY